MFYAHAPRARFAASLLPPASRLSLPRATSTPLLLELANRGGRLLRREDGEEAVPRLQVKVGCHWFIPAPVLPHPLFLFSHSSAPAPASSPRAYPACHKNRKNQSWRCVLHSCSCSASSVPRIIILFPRTLAPAFCQISPLEKKSEVSGDYFRTKGN